MIFKFLEANDIVSLEIYGLSKSVGFPQTPRGRQRGRKMFTLPRAIEAKGYRYSHVPQAIWPWIGLFFFGLQQVFGHQELPRPLVKRTKLI